MRDANNKFLGAWSSAWLKFSKTHPELYDEVMMITLRQELSDAVIILTRDTEEVLEGKNETIVNLHNKLKAKEREVEKIYKEIDDA